MTTSEGRQWTTPDGQTTPAGGLQQWLMSQSGRTRSGLLADWLDKARHVYQLPADEPWPAWSSGEVLAVGLIVGDDTVLANAGYTRDQALDRLRCEIGDDSIDAARQTFAELRQRLHSDRPGEAGHDSAQAP